MDISFYKTLHLIGVLLLFQSLGAFLYNAMTVSEKVDERGSKMLTRLHGIAALLIVVSGGGMLAKQELFWPLPGWVWIMIVAWIMTGICRNLVSRKPDSARMWWSLTIVLGIAAVLSGVLRPF